MRRLPILVALTIASVVAASAWFVIDAESEQAPLVSEERLPRDEHQEQEEGSQEEPGPSPGDAEAETADEESESEAAENDPPQQEQADVGAGADDQAVRDDAEGQPESTADLDGPLDPTDVVIAALAAPPRAGAASERSQPLIHVVQESEKLTDIAARYGVSVSELIAANDLSTPDSLDVRQRLRIYPAESEPGPTYAQTEATPGAWADGGPFYGTIDDVELDVRNSVVVVVAEHDPTVWFVRACINGERRIYLMGLTSAEDMARVYWRVNEGPLATDRWFGSGDLLESRRLEPLRADLEQAERLWLRVGSTDAQFDVSAMQSTPIEGNLLNCGS